MKLTKLAGDCGGKDCPNVYLTDRGTVAIQGDLLTELDDLRPSRGEAVVEIPLHLLLAAAREAE
jgi:hypothetical protein